MQATAQQPRTRAHTAQATARPPRRAAVAPPIRSAGRSRLAWARAARVQQWPKNLLVFVVPAAAGALGRPGVLRHVCGAFVVFCVLSAGVYLINDVRDAPEDRRHPRKRYRPIAAGVISPKRAFVVGIGALVVGVCAAAAVTPALAAAAAAYAALNIGYTWELRSVPLIDILAISLAFVLRIVSGGTAANVHTPVWLVVSVWLVALFVAAGKRYAELLDPAGRRSRSVLELYSPGGLRLVITVAFAGAIVSYCAWAFAAAPGPWRPLTVIAFAIALWRYRGLVLRGRGGAPERILFGDVIVQLAAVSWLVAFALGG